MNSKIISPNSPLPGGLGGFKTIIFDFGGVIMTLAKEEAMRRFASLGLPDVEKHLDAYTQKGIFGDVEQGVITDEEFRQQLSALCHRELTWQECQWAWLGYCADVPKRNITILKDLRKAGYRLIMLSNTNPFMMNWVMGPTFSHGLDDDAPEGMPASHYFDAAYLSYKLGYMKPDPRFFEHVINAEHLNPSETLFVDDGPRNIEAALQFHLHTLCPANGSDWISDLLNILDNR